jgi:hypothetical protein
MKTRSPNEGKKRKGFETDNNPSKKQANFREIMEKKGKNSTSK